MATKEVLALKKLVSSMKLLYGIKNSKKEEKGEGKK